MGVISIWGRTVPLKFGLFFNLRQLQKTLAPLQSSDSDDARRLDGGQELDSSYGRDREKSVFIVEALLHEENMNRKSV